MSDDEFPTIVIDNGSHTCKAGFCGDDAPRAVLPSIVGRNEPIAVHNLAAYVGDSLQAKRHELQLNHPIVRGHIVDWDDMQALWSHIYLQELRIAPENQKVLMTETSHTPKLDRQRITDILFEVFSVPGMNIVNQAVLGLYASGRTTGLVVDSGEGVTRSVPIFDGFPLPHAFRKFDLGGAELTDYLLQLLNERGFALDINKDRELVDSIKRKLGYVAMDSDNETTEPSSFQLPDGNTIDVGDERYKCAEPLFKPNLVGLDANGIHEIIHSSIVRENVDIRKDFWNNIVLAGGTTLLPGIANRIRSELAQLSPSSMQIKIVEPQERLYSAWIGGSILASLSEFNQWLTKQEYEEKGSSAIHCYAI